MMLQTSAGHLESSKYTHSALRRRDSCGQMVCVHVCTHTHIHACILTSSIFTPCGGFSNYPGHSKVRETLALKCEANEQFSAYNLQRDSPVFDVEELFDRGTFQFTNLKLPTLMILLDTVP